MGLASSATSFPRRELPHPTQFVKCFYAHHQNQAAVEPLCAQEQHQEEEEEGGTRIFVPLLWCSTQGQGTRAGPAQASIGRSSQLPPFGTCGSPERSTFTQITAFSAATKVFMNLFNPVLGILVPILLAHVEGPVPTAPTTGTGHLWPQAWPVTWGAGSQGEH